MLVNEQSVTAAPAARAAAALRTRLDDALRQTIAALAGHTAHLPEGTLHHLDQLLAQLAAQRVQIAIYGEVKAGKSTLLNALAGAALSPVAFDPLTSVPVRVTYGNITRWHTGRGPLSSLAELEELLRTGTEGIREVVAETPMDLLELGGQVDLIDTPGVGSETRFDNITAQALRSLDAVVVVVRYPALFTQVTRQLVEQLATDMAKLFVVWNLDGACADLTPSERSQHAEALCSKLDAAPEIFPVDARAATRAQQADDIVALRATGLPEFAVALTRFLTSRAREITVVREAAKRAAHHLDAAQDTLRQRHAALTSVIAAAQRRLDAIDSTAAAAAEAARARLNDFDTATAHAVQQHKAAAATRAADLRKQLRAARRRWVKTTDLAGLEAAVTSATDAYADGVANACSTTLEALRTAAVEFGSAVDAKPRPRQVPSGGALSSEDRQQRAVTGHLQRLRRALWASWYLPGVTTLERTATDEDVASQATWLSECVTTAASAARALLQTRLDGIARHTDSEKETVIAETNLVANETELKQLREHLPILATQRAAVVEAAKAARELIG